jgi:excisionase family DNA binding protein
MALEVLTLSEAAAHLRLPEADVVRLVDEQALPAHRLKNEWRFLKTAIQDWLRSAPPKSNIEAWMELAGVWKDDPYGRGRWIKKQNRRGIFRPFREAALFSRRLACAQSARTGFQLRGGRR